MLEVFDALILGRARWDVLCWVSVLSLCDKSINGKKVVMGRAPKEARFPVTTACE